MSRINGLTCTVCALFLTFISAPAFSANGVSLDVLREDPYALDGSTISAAEQNRARGRDGLAEDEEDTTTERPRVFTNADNWPLYPWTVYEAEADQSQTVNENEKVTITAVAEVKPEQAKDETQDEKSKDLLKKTKRLHLDAFYSAYYVPMTGTQTLPTYFGDLTAKMNLQIFSFGGRGEFSIARFLGGAFGAAVDATWSSLSKGSVAVNQFTANGFVVLRYKPTEKFAFVFEAGAGALMFFDNKVLGFENFIYPEVSGGILLESYFFPIFSTNLGVKVTYPFLLPEQYPMIQLNMGVAFHF